MRRSISAFQSAGFFSFQSRFASCSHCSRTVYRLPITSQASPSLYPGAVVEVSLSNGRTRLAEALRPDGKKNWIVIDALGASQSITPKQITFHVGKASDVLEGTDNDLKKLEDFACKRAEEASELLEVAWDILRDSEEGFVSAAEVAEVVFGDTEQKAVYATHTLLTKDGVYFKLRNIKGEIKYEIRSEELVKQSKVLIIAESERKRKVEEDAQYIRNAVMNNEGVDLLRTVLGDKFVENAIRGLETLAMETVSATKSEREGGGSDAAFAQLNVADRDSLRKIFQALGKQISPLEAFDVLVRLGVYKRHENLLLKREALDKDIVFQEQIQNAAMELFESNVSDIDESRRLDLSHLTAYAVDSEDTTEVDDAFSWDEKRGVIWVHIADPTRYVDVSNIVVQEALRRVATLYLPTGKITMFPETLASDLFSLGGEESDGCALSFGVRIADDGSLDEDKIFITPSKIAQPTRVTYDELDKRLEVLESGDVVEQDLQTLIRLTKKREEYRKREGALSSNQPFSNVCVKNGECEEPSVTVESIRSDTDAWKMVSELMIAACTVAGLFAEDHEIPVIFRGQDVFEIPPQDVRDAIPEGPARNAILFKNASPSLVSLEPLFHASLFADAYVQVTSPIRRSVDLVAHFQIKAFLRGDTPPFQEDSLNDVIARDASRGRVLRQVENRTKKYWQLEYLKRLGPDVDHDCIFVKWLKDTETKFGVVHFEQFAFDCILPVPPNLERGAQLSVFVLSSEPRTGLVRARIRPRALTAQADIAACGDDFFEELFSDIESADSSNVLT